jgi:hypothetical protein
MNRDVMRVVIAAMASLAMIIAATLFVEWFIVDFANVGDIATVTFDLREARACSHLGPCAVVPMSMIKGSLYPALASVTLWAGLVFAALVLYQCGTRILTGSASHAVGRIAHLLGVIVMMTGVGAGYVFGPDFKSGAMMGFAVARGWGPMLMLLGLVAGHVAVYFTREVDESPAFRQVDLPPAQARTRSAPRPVSTRMVPLPMTTPPHGHPTVRPATNPPALSRTPTPSRDHGATIPPHPSTGITALADVWRGKVKFAVLTGELSIAGIDARREDGGSVLVMWRDVVGLVARRLPGDLGSHPFVDIVSTAGMTLRILPWSRMTGETISGEPESRVRTFMKLVAPRCPEAQLDRATQAFLADDAKSPAQLPNLDMLAKHDAALA